MKVKKLNVASMSTWERAFGAGSRVKYAKKIPEKMSEWHTHVRVCHHLRSEYPDTRFYSTLDGFNLGNQRGLLPAIQWTEAGVPDLFVYHRTKKHIFLVIELKKHGVKLRENDEHQQRQAGWLAYFKNMGANAQFAVGLDEAISIIDKHMKQ